MRPARKGRKLRKCSVSGRQNFHIVANHIATGQKKTTNNRQIGVQSFEVWLGEVGRG